MDIFDFKPIECPVCGTPMRCVHISVTDIKFNDDDRYTIMYRCKKRHIFQGTFDEAECLELKNKGAGNEA